MANISRKESRALGFCL